MATTGAVVDHPGMTKRWTCLAVVVLLAVLTGCGSDDGPSADAARTTTSALASPLEGRWRTAPINPLDVAEALRGAGYGRWIEPLRDLDLIQGPSTELALDIREDWDLTGSVNGGVG